MGDEEDLPHCYICLDEDDLVSDVCDCRTHHLHVACQRKHVWATQSASCTICKAPYRNLQTRYVVCFLPTVEGWIFGMYGAGALLLLIETFDEFDLTTTRTRSSLFLLGLMLFAWCNVPCSTGWTSLADRREWLWSVETIETHAV